MTFFSSFSSQVNSSSAEYHRRVAPEKLLGNGIDEHAKNKSERNEVVIAGYLGKAEE